MFTHNICVEFKNIDPAKGSSMFICCFSSETSISRTKLEDIFYRNLTTFQPSIPGASLFSNLRSTVQFAAAQADHELGTHGVCYPLNTHITVPIR